MSSWRETDAYATNTWLLTETGRALDRASTAGAQLAQKHGKEPASQFYPSARSPVSTLVWANYSSPSGSAYTSPEPVSRGSRRAAHCATGYGLTPRSKSRASLGNRSLSPERRARTADGGGARGRSRARLFAEASGTVGTLAAAAAQAATLAGTFTDELGSRAGRPPSRSPTRQPTTALVRALSPEPSWVGEEPRYPEEEAELEAELRATAGAAGASARAVRGTARERALAPLAPQWRHGRSTPLILSPEASMVVPAHAAAAAAAASASAAAAAAAAPPPAGSGLAAARYPTSRGGGGSGRSSRRAAAVAARHAAEVARLGLVVKGTPAMVKRAVATISSSATHTREHDNHVAHGPPWAPMAHARRRWKPSRQQPTLSHETKPLPRYDRSLGVRGRRTSVATPYDFYAELEKNAADAPFRVFGSPLDSRALGRDVDAPLQVSRLLPELFLLGGVKCASTFLFDCINSGLFDVNANCGSDVSKWRTCDPAANRGARAEAGFGGRRYLVTSLGRPKEPFGFTRMQWHKGGLERYAGPDVPLELLRYHGSGGEGGSLPLGGSGSLPREGEFLQTQCKPGSPLTRRRVPCGSLAGLCRVRPNNATLGRRGAAMASSRDPGVKRAAVRTHPGCIAVKSQTFEPLVQLHHHYPWREDLSEHALAAEGTPNYLMSQDVPRRVWEHHEGHRDRLRFIVLLRDPTERAYSEYSMFRTWGWEKEPNVTLGLLKKAGTLSFCTNGLVLGDREEEFDSLDEKKLRMLYDKCFDGKATKYFENGLYYIGLKVWMSYFHPSQFLVMTFDEVTKGDPEQLLRRVAQFAGLATPDRRSREGERYWQHSLSKCTIRKGQKKPQQQTKGHMSKSDKDMLRRMFRPWNERLKKLLPDVPIGEWGD